MTESNPWQPIESAPYKTPVKLGYQPNKNKCLCKISQNKSFVLHLGKWWDEDQTPCPVVPTHWMPLSAKSEVEG